MGMTSERPGQVLLKCQPGLVSCSCLILYSLTNGARHVLFKQTQQWHWESNVESERAQKYKHHFGEYF